MIGSAEVVQASRVAGPGSGLTRIAASYCDRLKRWWLRIFCWIHTCEAGSPGSSRAWTLLTFESLQPLAGNWSGVPCPAII